MKLAKLGTYFVQTQKQAEIEKICLNTFLVQKPD